MALTQMVKVPARDVPLKQSGSVQDAIVTVHVDAFGADPSGLSDSSAAFMAALSKATEGINVSNFSKTQTAYAKVIIGKGRYIANNVIIPSGVVIEGQGPVATLVYPTEENAWVFTTSGTTASDSDPEQRMAFSHISRMTIGCGEWTEDIYNRPTGTGGIYVKSGTYCRTEFIEINRLNGDGLRLEGCWDSDYYSVKISNCDGIGLYVGDAVDSSGASPSNALRFWGLHIENCHQNFVIGDNSRHVYFNSCKIESSEVTIRVASTIGVVREVVFNSPELTWQYQDVPMISITANHFGVVFNSPQPVSKTTTMGYYLHHSGSQAPLEINNVDGFAVWKLVTGKNVSIHGGKLYNCGPCIIDLTSDVYISNFKAIVPVATVTGNGTDDVIRVNGGNVSIEGCNLYCAGTVTDGSAAIYVGASCSNPRIKNNNLRGTKNYGIRVVSGAVIAANLLCDNIAASSYGGLITGYTARYSVTSRNDGTGFGDGNVKASTVTVAAGGSASLNVVAGASDILIRTLTSSGGVTAGKFFADYQSTAINAISLINGIKLDTGTGVAGDGFIYVSKSGTTLTIKNYTLLSLTANVTVISALS